MTERPGIRPTRRFQRYGSLAGRPAWSWGSPRGTLALAVVTAGAIANMFWLGFGAWFIATGLSRVLVLIVERLR